MRIVNKEPHPGGRPTCLKCFRPCSHCLCDVLTPFEAHCNVLILQHPAERRKYYSTAKLVTNLICNSKRIRGLEFSAEEISRQFKSNKTYLMYPSAEAVDCVDIPLNSNDTVIVVDGTWIEARKILYKSPHLKSFQHLTFKAPLVSNYQIRKQPKENYLSTIESIGHLLKLNAEANGLRHKLEEYQKLFDIFNKMVEQQLINFPRMRAPNASVEQVEVKASLKTAA